MNTKNTDEAINDLIAMVFGNEKIRELGKSKSEWFKEIFDALDNSENGFLEFIVACELRHGEIVSREELIPTTSILLIKLSNKNKEKREKAISDFINGDSFNDFCKEVFYSIKENAKNGNS